MFEIDNILVSTEIFENCFVCDLDKCLGHCCIDGISGAPLEDKEAEIMEQAFNDSKPWLTEAGIKSIEEKGFFEIDFEGDKVTPLINKDECAYAYRENGILLCAIEKAWLKGKSKFRKPVSCHLYPIRIDKVGELDAVNYNRQKYCKSACTKGEELKIPLYKFLKEPLIRKYGEEWYETLTETAKFYEEEKQKRIKKSK